MLQFEYHQFVVRILQKDREILFMEQTLADFDIYSVASFLLKKQLI